MNFKIKNVITSLMLCILSLLGLAAMGCQPEEEDNQSTPSEQLPDVSGYPIASTNQSLSYNNNGTVSTPGEGSDFYGQDANYNANELSYLDNGNGTVTDLVTGLMWQKDPGEKMTYEEAVNGASSFNLGGFSDWRLPSIKELYSLITFSGEDPSGYQGTSTAGLVPFINTDFFRFEYGNINAGERIIDSQFATSTLDIGDTQFGGGDLMFGVNFADGRIKGYPTGPRPGETAGKGFFVLYVRGNSTYGINDFVDNGDGTITDKATGLMWMKNDNQEGLDWKAALSYAENMEFAGYSDWTLPDAKQLQSIVDYTRAPGATDSAAIDPVFNCTQITNEGGQADFPFYWSSTTHANRNNGRNAAYVSFGRALGYFNGQWMDVHGAGAQRSDPKTGDPADYPFGHGPQGDAIRILNYVRLVREVE